MHDPSRRPCRNVRIDIVVPWVPRREDDGVGVDDERDAALEYQRSDEKRSLRCRSP